MLTLRCQFVPAFRVVAVSAHSTGVVGQGDVWTARDDAPMLDDCFRFDPLAWLTRSLTSFWRLKLDRRVGLFLNFFLFLAFFVQT